MNPTPRHTPEPVPQRGHTAPRSAEPPTAGGTEQPGGEFAPQAGTQRLDASSITDDQLDALYDERDRAHAAIRHLMRSLARHDEDDEQHVDRVTPGQLKDAVEAVAVALPVDPAEERDVVWSHLRRTHRVLTRRVDRATAARDRYRSAWRSARDRATTASETINRVCRDRDSYKGWMQEAQAAVQQLAARVETLEKIARQNRDHAWANARLFLAVEAELDAIEREQHGQHDEDADGMREAVRRIRAVLSGEQPEDTCRPVDIDGETIRVRGASDMTDQERGYFAEIVQAARRRYTAEHGQPDPEAEACERHPNASRIGGRCGACTLRPDPTPIVHACPPPGSGLTPCCGRTPFELPLGDRMSIEQPTTCTELTDGSQP